MLALLEVGLVEPELVGMELVGMELVGVELARLELTTGSELMAGLLAALEWLALLTALSEPPELSPPQAASNNR